jgi:hypothetical protein
VRSGSDVFDDEASLDASGSVRAVWWRQVLLIAWLWWVYDLINNFSPVREDRAIRIGQDLLAFEKHLSLDIELGLNRFVQDHHAVAVLLGNFYNIAHLLVTFVFVGILWWFFPRAYPRLRNTLAVTNVIGFAVFWMLPVAPPRMLPGTGFVDTVVSVGAMGSTHDGSLASQANQYAAMPSLHIAWAIWVAVALWTVSRSRIWRSVGVAHVAVTTLAVIGTANHYVLDVVAGAATFAVAMPAGYALYGRSPWALIGWSPGRGWGRSAAAVTMSPNESTTMASANQNALPLNRSSNSVTP